MNNEKSNFWKMVVAVSVIVAAGGWTFLRARNLAPGAVANNGQTEEFQRPSPEEIRANMKAAAAYAGLSTTQTQALEKGMEEMRQRMADRERGRGDADTTRPQMRRPEGAPGAQAGAGPPNPGQWRGQGGGGMMMGGGPMMGGADLTGEQRQKMREFMQVERGKREQKIKSALTPQEYDRYQQRQQESRGNRGRGGAGGRGGQTGGNTGR